MAEIIEHIPGALDRVTLQFATEGGAGSALIRWFTQSRWSHVDFVLPSGRLLGARLDGGVRVREPGYVRFAATARARVPTPHAALVYHYALAEVGKPYDWRAIVALALGRDWRNPSAWFCSELVAWACERAGEPLVNPLASSSRITPGDLALSVLLAY